ncbi:type II toxin-antitoxin system RatA family toxin [Aestuariispira insulae]|uniref:Coenzyme Q-binding protein COQ10 n=1 Tax=Aestuariispira insulae TaxID=1461337 RepID=A0A3D9HUT9_9PROT|nr:type II toxin-antitoxin system RatA family toxin [Aestuariispira insulae]RED53262.1 coenzyme Q-binding protein COQ10 [Aestuariispira insulae]
MPTHAKIEFVPHSPEQLFDLVADIERYPEFLPWCCGARIRKRVEDVVVADLIIGFKGINERYTSRVHLDKENLIIDVQYENGPFKHLKNHWKFLPADGGCNIDFYIDFEFKSRILQALIGALFNEAVHKMVSAFKARADQLYGCEH